MKFLILSLLSLNLFAFNLTPLSQSITLGKNSNTVIYQVLNKNKEPIAIEASLKIRKMGRDGKEELPDVEEGLFLIYPTQIILKPGEKRGIKIQYLGNNNLKNELSYRLLVEQLPVDFKKKTKTGVKLLLRYLGALYVTKDEFKPVLQVKSMKMVGTDLVIEIANTGSLHQVLKNLELTFFDTSVKKIVLTKDRLPSFNGENILAQSTRVFTISNLTEFKINQKSKVELSYD
ncbi:fimbria/pilus periplasmic chaperone [Bacteriovorax sp. Seq25_V]|uniref:fimbria/pilus periplasmic chaperone n=1 Tax=Bacteriovorax sp. Seq25_V TaxID=1201288 RepID=UPI00038A1B57|nr:fimbria/pilus periplasmic chaperone [Bacteriovorax sp. Seq25_V]EQC46249.1 gram-negative pili assembly chaperone, N-terminal domain protein [Bacteriovorax sp. Seq25_V]